MSGFVNLVKGDFLSIWMKVYLPSGFVNFAEGFLHPVVVAK